jgi:hypothetical protein
MPSSNHPLILHRVDARRLPVRHAADQRSLLRFEANLQIRRNLHALPGPARMCANLRRHAQHLALFVAVERPRKAKIRPTNRCHHQLGNWTVVPR